ncbi:MAG TPA: ATP-binding protein [Candidatus Chromulinivoraceae bacterium]|nr:ATP-binding protein [Candidatus Chromulinivoraceae bacterium]
MLTGLSELAGACAFIMNIFGLRTQHRYVIARSAFLIITLAVIMLTHLSGDTQATGLFWLILYVASAFILTSRRQGIWWIVGFFLTTILILVMRRFGIISTPYSFIDTRQILVTLPVAVVGISTYQYFQRKVKIQTDKGREALLEQKIRAETVLENVSEGVIAIDSKKRIILMNKASQDMLGWTFDEVAGKDFTEIVPALDEAGNVIQSNKRPVHKMLNSSSGLSQTMIYRRRNGTTFPVSMFGRSIVVNGKVLGVIGTFRDISEEQELEATKSEFVTLASHQLRTPISTIRWVSEMLLSGDVGVLSQEQWDYVNQIYTSNQRSVSIVDSLLLASTMEIGAISVRPEPVNLINLTHDLVDWLTQIFAAVKGQHVSEHYPHNLPKIDLDPELMRTILEAILTNAIKYTPNRGKISVTIIRSDMKISPKSKGSVSISITDTGYGIPKDQQKKVFAKLFRATNIKTRDTDGTGLGLHVANMIIKQVGGQIHFESRENEGSTFTITLPLEGMVAHE